MAQEAEACDSCRPSHLLGCAPVRVAWLGVATRMVVSQGEGSAVVAEDGIEDLTHRHQRLIDRTGGDRHGAAKPVCGVADQDDNPFTTLPRSAPA